jgi:DNA-binding MarR family transcriptional regulator
MKKNRQLHNTGQVREECLCLHVLRAARAVSRRYDEAFRGLGINSWQFTLLTALDRDMPPSIGQLAGDLVMDRTTLTANLKPLQRQGLIDLVVDEDDARSRRISLTDTGRALLFEALPAWRRAQATTGARLGPAELNSLRDSLRALE